MTDDGALNYPYTSSSDQHVTICSEPSIAPLKSSAKPPAETYKIDADLGGLSVIAWVLPWT